ncbi:MAG: hypothetical protein ACPGEG_00645 [Salibacteraceae bacterium]
MTFFTKLKPLLYLTLLISCSTRTPLLVQPGENVGTYVIEETTINDVLNLNGNNFTFEQGITEGVDWSVYTNRYVYDQIGKTFITRTNEDGNETLERANLSGIILFSGNYKTADGIILQVSKYADVIKRYGQPELIRENINGHVIAYKSRGISFLIERETKTVITFEIYKKNGISDLL